MAYWLVKQEPESYAFSAFQAEQTTAWTGVRNYQARNNLRAMARGDRAVYYHSGKEKAVVGLAEVAGAAYPDPTAADGDWSCVDLRAGQALGRAVPLNQIKADPLLPACALVT
nr:EVE domain-containing protein [Planctomycetota bacterium]